MSALPFSPVIPLGQIVATPGALAATTPEMRLCYLRSHALGNWGCVGFDDWQANDQAVEDGSRVLSAYPINRTQACAGHGANTVWVITEADRSVTTILLPSEY